MQLLFKKHLCSDAIPLPLETVSLISSLIWSDWFRGSNVEAEKTRKAGISRSNKVNWKFRCNSLSQLILIWNWWEGGQGDTERPICLQWLKELYMNNAQLEFRKNKPWFIYSLSIKYSIMSLRPFAWSVDVIFVI